MKKRKVKLEDIINEYPELDYPELCAQVAQLIESGVLLPDKCAKNNGESRTAAPFLEAGRRAGFHRNI